MNKNKLYDRVYADLQNRRERVLSGKINCIPWKLPRFERELAGIEQGKYYLITANTKVGKTQIADWLFFFNTIEKIVNEDLPMKIKIFYFTLELSKEDKMLSAFSNILYVKEGIRLAPKDLRSTRTDNILSEEVLATIKKYKKYFEKIEEVVEFIDDIRHPTGIFNIVRDYALANGTQHKKTVLFKNHKDKTTYERKIDDWYEPNDPEEYVMIMIDHISLISTEKEDGRQLNLHQSITKLSSRYLVALRNKYNYIPIVIQQQAAAQESVENLRANKLKPSLDGLGDCKLTARDCDVAIGVFSPFRHELPTYQEYDIKKFRDNIRFMEILAGRSGGGGIVCPLYFDGAVNVFRELPLPNNIQSLQKVYKLLDKIRK